MTSIYADTEVNMEVDITSYSPNMKWNQMKPLIGKLGMRMNMSEADMHDCLSKIQTGQKVDRGFYTQKGWAGLSTAKKTAVVASPFVVIILIFILWLIFKQ